MQKITLICVGKLGQEFLQKGCAEYAKRLSSFCDLRIIELQEELDQLQEDYDSLQESAQENEKKRRMCDPKENYGRR